MAIDWDRFIEVATGESLTVITVTDEETVNVSAGKEIIYVKVASAAAAVDWGNIDGVMSNQTDLTTALAAKLSDAPSDDGYYVRRNAAWVSLDDLDSEGF